MKDLFGNNIVKALTWKEPFASLMLHGKTETRVWDTAYRGTVLICSGLAPFSEPEMLNMCGPGLMQHIVNTLCEGYTERYKLGVAIAIGDLVHTRPMRQDDEHNCFVKYSPERFCHIYENVRPIEPFIFKGAQGWKNVTGVDLERLDPLLK